MGKGAAKFIGKWEIVEMEQWDKDYIDLEETGFIQIRNKGTGEFRFGCVYGGIHWVVEENGRDGKIGFTWDGNDEMDPVTGRGWLIQKEKDGLFGKIFIHNGDDSWLKCKRFGKVAKKSRK